MQRADYIFLFTLVFSKLRHTYATHLIQNGADIETTRRMLGHSSINTTAIYVHSTFDQMKAAADRLKYD